MNFDNVSVEIEVKLPNDDEWKPIKKDESFTIPANSKFQVNVQ